MASAASPAPDATTPPSRLGAAASIGLMGLTLALTLARSVRWPNDFAEAHWLLDYRFGFVKRGLAGEVLWWLHRPAGADVGEGAIAAAALVVLLSVCACLIALMFRISRASHGDPAALLAGLALASSPFVVMAGHLTGYLDGVIVLLAFGAVWAMTARRPWLAAAAAAAAMLVHESALLVVVPVLMLAWWLAYSGRPPAARMRAALAFALPLGAFAAVALAGQVPPDVEDAYSARLAAAGFVGGDMHLLVPEWLRPDFLESYRANRHRFAERIAFAEMYGLMLPTVLALAAYAIDAYGLRARSIAVGALPVVILAPELLHIAAWDTVRIWTWTVVTSALALLAVSRTMGPPVRVGTVVRALGLVAVAVNVVTVTPMLDNLADRYALATRLLMYTPVLAAAVWLFFRPGRLRVGA